MGRGTGREGRCWKVLRARQGSDACDGGRGERGRERKRERERERERESGAGGGGGGGGGGWRVRQWPDS